jgi:FkbM family methyltransferase
LDLQDKTIYDIGAHIGLVTMFFSKVSGKNGKVLSFEPNPQSYSFIKTNVELNRISNVQIFNIGLGEKKDKRKLVFNPYFSGTGSMDKEIQKDMRNKDNIIKTIEVEVDSLDSIIEVKNLPKPDMVKLDVEGMEYFVLLGMKKTLSKDAPSLFIEIHGGTNKNKIANSKRILDFLDSYQFSFFHIESKSKITKSDFQVAKSGHIFCTKSPQEYSFFN